MLKFLDAYKRIRDVTPMHPLPVCDAEANSNLGLIDGDGNEQM